MSLKVCIIIYIISIACLANCASIWKSPSTLILVHALFRHGERTPDKATTWPTNPLNYETYYPYGWAQLTNRGKRTEYRLGQILRKRYLSFLGKTWTPDVLEGRSTGTNRTKMSLGLVLAGLYPPVGLQLFMPGLYWQPIPYNYVDNANDDLLWPVVACPKFEEQFEEVIKTEKHLAELEQYKSLFEYLTLQSGKNVTDYIDCQMLYFGIQTAKELGKQLPDWTKLVYPEPLRELAIKSYETDTYTNGLKRTVTGALIKKIVDDTKAKIDGTLNPKDRKLFLYSAHEVNLAYFLRALDIFQPPHVPPYGSCIILEVHKIQNEVGVKIYYEDYTPKSPKLLTLPGCSSFCELEKFVTIVSDVFSTADSCK